MPNRYALIIGNSEYSDSKLAKLRTPDSDVNALANVLRNINMGNFDDVEVLLNQDSATVRKTITKFFFQQEKRRPAPLIFFRSWSIG
jgi:chaperonin GroEL